MQCCQFIVAMWALILLPIKQICSDCLVKEKRALLDFKASLNLPKDDHLVLPSWTDAQEEQYNNHSASDCCNWEGVRCSHTTGRIVELNLRDLGVIILNDYDFQVQFLNMSVFLPLESLQVLDLSYDFREPEIAGCEHADRFKILEYLRMDWNFFNNSIIPCVTAIPSLKVLSLSGSESTEGSFPTEEFSRLKQLEHLDLSFANFSGSLSFKELKLQNLEVLNMEGIQINELLSIEVMTSLKALSLSDMKIHDSTILQGICSFKNLVELDLSNNQFSGNIPLCLSDLTSLKALDISKNNFSGSIPPLLITNLMHLEYLSLSDNHFEGSFSFGLFANHSKLQVLELAPSDSELYIDFNGMDLPAPFQLRVLNLAGCNLNNESRQVLNFLLYQNELRFLDLSSNHLVGMIPLWLLENNLFLEILVLRDNSFTGPFFLDGTPKLHLLRLDISNNEVSGQVPQDIGLLFPTLNYLNLSRNSLEGIIPESIGNLTRAISIDLSSNNFFGEMPDRIGTGCVQLQILLLSNNNLQGHLSSSMNLTILEILYLDNNNFSGSISEALSHSSILQFLDISKNKFTGKIPSWIGNFSSFLTLDLSQNQLEGTIPGDICKLTTLSFLDLSENELIGSIPSCSSLLSLRFIHLQRNAITGSIPNALFGSLRLMTLDLGYNYLSGGIPHEIVSLAQLRVLLFGGNNLQGQIPMYICQLKSLTIVDLSHNNFFEQIPSCLSNITFGSGHFDYDPFDNNDGGFVAYGNLNTYLYNSSLSLNSDFGTQVFTVSDVQEEVAFTTKSRTDTYAGYILNYMSGLDLSCNQLTGELPPEIGDLIDLRALNLSHNHLQGSIPSILSMLNLIESLDLSYNNFSGQIPSQLNRLTTLVTFNVSYNNLSGMIPETRQFWTFDESSYKGNPNLCGPMLKKSCNSITVDPVHVTDGEETDGTIDIEAFLWSFFAGFIAVLSAFALSIYISPHYRKAWFGFIDTLFLSRFYHRFKFHSKSS